MPPANTYLRLSLLAVLSVWGGGAFALGLGELRTHSYLGQPLLAEVEVLANGKETVDASCFRLRSPQGDTDLPWLQRASFTLRRGATLVLEIRSALPLRDPVLQVGIGVACGHEVQRDYTLFLSPRGTEADLPAQAAAPVVAPPIEPPVAAVRKRMPPPVTAETPQPRLTPRKAEKRAKPLGMPDRLVLSGGGEGVGEPSLRLATELLAWKEGAGAAGEAQREILRLEYRMLAAMNEQATSQLAAAEKLRSMETTLAELQQRTGELANRIEKGTVPATAPTPMAPPKEAVPPAPVAPPKAEAPRTEPPLLTEWSFYGALLGIVLGLAGWLGWRQYRERQERVEVFEEPVPEPVMDAPQPAEVDEFDEIDLHVGPAVPAAAMQVDVPLDGDEAAPAVATPAAPVATMGGNAPLSVADATVAEHFEVNPVMELAEIMLSFGRVKGAAQALQEYIDHNPEEALQPWIRLMDVYRMAGMRGEFDRLAKDLNRHFNVEVQEWEPARPVPSLDQPLDFILNADEVTAAPSSSAPKAMTLEDIEHIRNKLIGCWGTAECVEYLNQLLRDNRGGKRSGFTLPVVEEILFLVELLGTRNLMEKEATNGDKNE